VQDQTTPDEDAETVRRLQQDVFLQQCQIDGWPKHKKECKRARKRKKLDYSKDKFLVGELLSVVMRGGGHKGVLGTILSYI